MGIFNKLFNKRSVNDNSYDIINVVPESWSVLKGKNKGNPMMIRKNMGCEKIAGNTNYPTNCGIAFKLLFPRVDGFPNIENEPELNTLEDDIFDLFETDLNSIIPLVITTSGFREYVLYTKDLAEFKVRLEKLKSKYKQYELTSYDQPDTNWKTYKSFK